MPNPPHLEVPEAVRKMAEENIARAREAYDRFMDMARQAQSMMQHSSGAMTDSTRELQSTALKYAEQNMEAGFEFVTELSRARDLKQYLEIQSRHTHKSMQTYTEQAQELARLMGEAAKRGQKSN